MTTRQKALLVATFLLALSIRLFFVGTVFEQSMAIPQDTLRSQNTTYIAEDSRMYLRLAFEAMENGILSAGNERRTPGYPLFLALLGISPLFVLFTQCVLVSLIPAGTYYLILKATQRTSFALIAGIYLAVHPSLVGVSGFLIPDALFCVLFFFAALTLWWATSTNKNSLFLLSGVLWAAGLLVKPVLLLGIVLAPLLYICLAYALETKIKRLPLLLLIVPLITLATGWSAINYTKTGMFTYSTIGTFTAHEYLAARVEASKELGRLPTWDEMKAKRHALRKHKANAKLSMPEQVDYSRKETIRILSSSPLRTLQCWALNIWENAFTGWDGFPNQLPLGLGNLNRAILNSLYVEKYVRILLMLLCLIAAPYYILYRKALGAWQVGLFFFFFLISCYFLFLSGISFLTGTRLFLPAEFALLCCTMQIFSRRRHQAPKY